MTAILPITLTLYGQPVSGLSIPVGSTVGWSFYIEDPITRAPVDLTVMGTAVQFSWAALDIKGNPITPALFSHQATIPGSPTNLATVLQTSGDTVPSGTPLAPGTYGVDVWFTDGSGNRLQTLGTALVELTAVATLPGTPVTPAPPEQPLGQGAAGANGSSLNPRGVYDNAATYAPLDYVSIQVGDVTSSYTCILATTGHAPPNATYWMLSASGAIGQPTVVGAGAIPAGALIKVDTTTAGHYALWLHTDSETLIEGAAVTACGGAGQSFIANFVTGTIIALLSDGAATIPIGSAIIPSTTEDGCVQAGGSIDAALLGFNVGNVVPATLNAPVSCR